MSNYADLIERLQVIEAASAEINRAIARMLGWHRVEPRFARNKAGAWIAPEDFIGTYSDGSPKLDSLHGTEMWRDVPNYTGSLDAAVKIYPSKPPLISTDPIEVARDAIRCRAILSQEPPHAHKDA